jgi:hypothetical protein
LLRALLVFELNLLCYGAGDRDCKHSS